MKKKILVFPILILVILFFGFLVVKETKAGPEHNVWGWAWAGDTIGWVSFNCYNDYGSGMEGHCIADEYLADYGVHICVGNSDSTDGCATMVGDKIGRLTGYAWMGSTDPSFGWIDFDPRNKYGPYPEAPNWSACLDVPEGMQGTAVQPCDDVGDWTLSGWARALNVDAWIKLRGTWIDPVILDIIPDPDREFKGWAWANGGSVLGWISFNSSNRGGAVDYKVMTSVPPFPISPTAINLNIIEGNYCGCAIGQTTKCSGSKSSPPIYLNWAFDDPGDTQSAYQIQIDNSGVGFPSPEVDTGKVLTPGPGPDYSYAPIGLSFNTPEYSWRLKVWDEGDAESGWINAPATFTTGVRWPNTKFTPDLLNPPAEVKVTFVDESKCYTAAGGEYDCKDGAGVTYSWDFGDGNISGDKVEITHSYAASGDYVVRLEVTGSMCPCVFPLTATLPLPTWKEIVPF